MQFRTELHIPPSQHKITYHTPALFMGSCFSDHIGGIMQKYKFPVLINPAGTIYNPVSLSSTLINALDSVNPDEDLYISRDDIWYHFGYHSSIAALDKAELEKKIMQIQNRTVEFLSNAKYIFLTLGTALYWTDKNTGKTVANCHKMPAERFHTAEISVKEGFSALSLLIERLKDRYPDLKIVLTISPVRHTRSGILENSRSKSRLIQMTDYLLKNFHDIQYFPAYEWMMDDLRDYRYYAQDMVHPNEMAIAYIWEKFRECYFEGDTDRLMGRIAKVVQAAAHRPFNPDSGAFRIFAQKNLEEIKSIQKSLSLTHLDEEENYFLQYS
ncbi:MAG: GSCFA domain-containing protein [Saprospiraceae bacterium]|nr:GSCFA domain-containing protein [Saprospiraceae bacterium]